MYQSCVPKSTGIAPRLSNIDCRFDRLSGDYHYINLEGRLPLCPSAPRLFALPIAPIHLSPADLFIFLVKPPALSFAVAAAGYDAGSGPHLAEHRTWSVRPVCKEPLLRF